MDTNSDCDNTALAAGIDNTIAFRVRCYGAPRPVLPDTTFGFNTPRGVLHTRAVLAYARSIDIGDPVEPEPIQADLPMQSDPGAPASFKDIVNIADVNERNEWYTAHTTPRLMGCSTCQLGCALYHVHQS
eukprot:6212505-Pleurochrysis_carterae.AAC.3